MDINIDTNIADDSVLHGAMKHIRTFSNYKPQTGLNKLKKKTDEYLIKKNLSKSLTHQMVFLKPLVKYIQQI